VGETLSDRDAWRAIILYGLNTATYKIALGQALAGFATDAKTRVSMEDLARAFLLLYRDRLESGRPQLLLPDRRTVMERVVTLHREGVLSEDEAVAAVARDAFHDVIPRFHTLAGAEMPTRFYEATPSGLVITDAALGLFAHPAATELYGELDSRWSLLEAAFDIRQNDRKLANDLRRVYLVVGHARTDVTHLRPALNGYQDGCCFYCGEDLGEADVHVDHVIPRQLVQHDEVWNLVLAHSMCNLQKSDALPHPSYIEDLVSRNERLIASRHPLRREMIEALGSDPSTRAARSWDAYTRAQAVIHHVWPTARDRRPKDDPLYRLVVRSLAK